MEIKQREKTIRRAILLGMLAALLPVLVLVYGGDREKDNLTKADLRQEQLLTKESERPDGQELRKGEEISERKGLETAVSERNESESAENVTERPKEQGCRAEIVLLWIVLAMLLSGCLIVGILLFRMDYDK
ncbi:MAG: hypothetical protein J6Z35_03060 [Lachnospiraceae bacterium]|nr:hypothetical protein [Lachnospiraceae bacterium]